MKQGWEYKKLGEVCEVVSGSTPKTNVPEYWGEGHYWVTPAELNDTIVYIDKTERQITDEALAKTKLRLLPVGTVLLSSRAPIGKVAITKTEMYCNQGFKNCICSDSIYNKYLFYFLRLKKEHLNSLGRGATFKEISKSIVESISISIPPKSTQLAIVSELDKINELIRLKKEQLKDYDNLAQSIFHEMFGDPVENEKGWEVKKLGELCDKISNGYNAKLEEDTYKSEGIMYFRCQNVWRNYFDYSDLVYIDEDTNQKMKSSSLKHNDFLITKIGRINTENSSLGRVSLYEGEDDKANLSGNLCFARLKKDAAVHKFILYILISNQFRNYIRRTTVGGIDKRALNVRQISSFPIISPPLPLQHLFAQRIEQIEHQKSEVTKAITDLETLLASRMQHWFE